MQTTKEKTRLGVNGCQDIPVHHVNCVEGKVLNSFLRERDATRQNVRLKEGEPLQEVLRRLLVAEEDYPNTVFI